MSTPKRARFRPAPGMWMPEPGGTSARAAWSRATAIISAVSISVEGSRARMDRVADSFAYPFRRGAGRAWLIGIPLVVLLPLGVVPLLGYAVAVVRSAATDPKAGLPPWRP